MDAPKVSVILLAYNVEEYLPAAMESLLDQTMEEIEIVAVDDGSDDGTARLLEEYAAKDDRVVVVTHEENRGCLAAHVSGIMAAQGDYCTFVAADDYLSLETCEACWEAIAESDVDVLQFGFEPFADKGCLSDEDKSTILSFSQPIHGAVKGDLIGDRCFVEGSISWNVAGKIMRTSLCRDACEDFEDMYLNFAEDCYLFFFVCLRAASYRGLGESAFYHYRIGSGISQNKLLDVGGYAKICDCVKAFDAMSGFLRRHEVRASVISWYEHARSRVRGDVIDRLVSYVRAGKGPEAFDILLARWDHVEICAHLDTSPWVPTAELACAAAGALSLKPSAPLNKIALLCGEGWGGPDCDAIVRSLECRGLDVVLKMGGDLERLDGASEPSVQCDRVSLELSTLAERLAESGSDTLVWMNGEKPLSLGEAVVVRSSGVRLIVVWRDGAWLPADWPSCTYLGRRLASPFVANVANALLCSEREVSFWRCFSSCVYSCETTEERSIAEAILHVDAREESRVMDGLEARMWMDLFADIGVLLDSQSSCWRTELEKACSYHESVEADLLRENEKLRKDIDGLVSRIDEYENTRMRKIRRALATRVKPTRRA